VYWIFRENYNGKTKGTEIGGDGGSREDDEYRWAVVEDPKK
jgi:hypothetical protein